ncbi:MAG TPA: transglutaminase domain-containing protein, partial [Bdellovibrionota bacterium]
MIRKQQLFLLTFLLLALLAPVHAFAGAVDGTCDLQALSGIAAHRKAAAAQKAGTAAPAEAPAVTLRSLETAEREFRSTPEAATAEADRLVEAGDEVSPELSDSLSRLESLQVEAAARAPKKRAPVAKVESLPQEVKKAVVPEPEPSVAPIAAARKAEIFSPSETIQARGPPARVPNALKGKEGKYDAKPVSFQDIPEGSVMEGSVGYGGIQPDYIVNFHAPEFDELRTFAQDVGQMRIHVTEKIDRINKRIRTNVLPGKSYTNSRYRGVVNTYRNANQDIPLSEYANCKAGVCRENALITHMALKEAGIPNRYVYAKAKLKFYSPDSGKIINEVAEDHAFVVTEINGKNWIVDSYNKAFNGFSFDQLRNPKLRKNTRLDALPFAEEQNDLVAGITEINGYPYVWVPKTAAARAEAKISQRAGVSTVRNAMVEPRPALPRAFWTRAQASRAAEIMVDGSDDVSRTIADGRRFMASEALSSEKISE